MKTIAYTLAMMAGLFIVAASMLSPHGVVGLRMFVSGALVAALGLFGVLEDMSQS